MSGPALLRDYHLLLDEHAEQIFAMTDDIAERVRKIGGTTIRSIAAHCAPAARRRTNDAEFSSTPATCWAEPGEVRMANKALVISMPAAHGLCDDAGDVATASLLENWIDETQRRVWFLFEVHPPPLRDFRVCAAACCRCLWARLAPTHSPALSERAGTAKTASRRQRARFLDLTPA